MTGLRVLAFGPLAEAMGGRRHDVALPPGATVADALAALPPSSFPLDQCQLRLDGEETDHTAPLDGHSELAILPPISGG